MVTVAAKSGLLIFLSTPSARRATACTTASTRPSTDFYPRPPRGGRRGRRSRRSPHREISIHALREEGDALRVSSNTASKYFYPRPPRGGRHLVGVNLSSLQDFYPRPPRGGRPMETCQIWRPIIYFYPRPPRGGRLASVALMVRHMGFLSTPSARRATHSVLRDPEHGAISIHALREEGDHRLRLQRLRLTISIHALREEGDPLPLRVFDYKEHFYPRPPRGGRPNNFATQAYPLNFYPRPPRGGRPDRCNAGMHACEFLSTPSARRATSGLRPGAQDHPISIHALREEGDPVFWYRPRSVLEFLSTPSARRATSPLCAISTSKRFLSTPSARRATVLAAKNPRCSVYFYPRPPRGGRPAYQVANPNVGVFLSTPSARRATPTATST